jgi:hypothetical protein
MSYKGLVFAAAALAVACASTAANADYYYSGYDYGSRTWNSGYGNIRPSFWGYPALLLRGDQTKVIATADEIEAAREYREYWEREYRERYAYGSGYDGYYDRPDLAAIPGALIGGIASALTGAAYGAARGADYYGGPDYGPAYYGSGYYSASRYDSPYGDGYYSRPRYDSAYDGPAYDSRPRYAPAYDGPAYDSGPRYGSAYYGEAGGNAGYYRGSYGGGAGYGSGWGD